MSSNLLPTVTVLGGITLFLGGLVYFIYWAQKKLEEAFHESARQAKLRRMTSLTDDQWQLKAAYEGMVDGARIRLGLGTRVVSAGGNSVPISGVLLQSHFSLPVPFDIELRRNAGVVSSNYRHSDAAFAKRCAVQTADPARTDRLLDDPDLRNAIAQFLKEGQGSAYIDRTAAFTVLFDARQTGPAGVLLRIRAIASLSKKLAERTRSL